jgi:hypothetical protein
MLEKKKKRNIKNNQQTCVVLVENVYHFFVIENLVVGVEHENQDFGCVMQGSNGIEISGFCNNVKKGIKVV